MRFGEAAVRREGDGVTIVGISRMAETALKAADQLAAEHGIEAEVIDPRTLRPLDLDTILDSVKKTNRAVIVEEGWPHGGVGANMAALIQEQAFDWLDAPVGRVTGADVPMPYSKPLEQAAVPARGARGAGGARHLQGRLAVASDVVMPRLSDSMEEGTVLKWLVEVGGEVKRGQPLVEIETDKANMTYDADTDGVLVEVVAAEGDTLAVGEVIARVGAEGEAPAEQDGAAKTRARRGAERGARAGAPAASRGAAASRRPRPPRRRARQGLARGAAGGRRARCGAGER